MNKIGVAIAIFTTVLLIAPNQSLSQPRMHQRDGNPWGSRYNYGRMYNPQTVETIKGEIVRIEAIGPMQRMSHGIHLLLKTDKEIISVHLGPRWYIQNQNLQIQPGDKIEVKGSRITFAGQPAIIAASVKKDNKVLTLRDVNGFPAWSRWQKR